MGFSVTSNSFKDGDYLANDHVLSESYGFGCAGNNQSPHLVWTEPPAGTESFTVTCFDPDAPTGSGFWHWLVINIPSDIRELNLGAGTSGDLPEGVRSCSCCTATSMASIQLLRADSSWALALKSFCS